MRNLQYLVEGAGKRAFENDIAAIVDIVKTTAIHRTPAVREAGCFLANAVLTASKSLHVDELLTELSQIIVSGLQDGVPSVRYAASIGARKFF